MAMIEVDGNGDGDGLEIRVLVQKENVEDRMGMWVFNCQGFQKLIERWIFFKIVLIMWVFYPISLILKNIKKINSN